MAHFARIENDTVQQVIVISNNECPDPAPDNEAQGQQFIADVLGLPGTWLQTSYNGDFRGTYAGAGYTYDPALDEFVPPPEEDPEPSEEDPEP
jgi:hypothetical protein